jgi:glycogen synthase
MLEALRQAVACFGRPDAWARVQAAGMAMDNSWDASARAYQAVYQRATAAATGRLADQSPP